MLWELRRAEPSHNSVFLAGCFCTLSSNTVRHPNADKVNSGFSLFLTGGLRTVGVSFFIFLYFFFLSNLVMGIILAS